MKETISRLFRCLQTGISFTLPLLVAGGICRGALPWCEGSIYELLLNLADICTWLAPVIFSVYTSYSIGDRPALIPAFVVGTVSQMLSLGITGALVGALLSGTCVWVLRDIPFPREMRNIKTLLVIPIAATLLPAAVIKAVVEWLLPLNGLIHWFLDRPVPLLACIAGALIAGVISLDMGGEKGNYSSLLVNLCLLDGCIWPTAAKIAGCIVPGMILALYFFVRRRGHGAGRLLLQACCQITEGVLSCSAQRPRGLTKACVWGAGMAGCLVVWGDVQCPVPHGGLFLLPFMSHPANFLLAIVAGCLFGVLLLLYFERHGHTAQEELLPENITIEWENF